MWTTVLGRGWCACSHVSRHRGRGGPGACEQHPRGRTPRLKPDSQPARGLTCVPSQRARRRRHRKRGSAATAEGWGPHPLSPGPAPAGAEREPRGTWGCEKRRADPAPALRPLPPRPAGRALRSPAVPLQLTLPSAAGSRPSVPCAPPAEAPYPPRTCVRSSRRPPPSRLSETPWTRAGLGRGRGRPLVAAWAVAAAPAAAPGPAGGWAGRDRRLLPAAAGRLPSCPGRRCPRSGPGVAEQVHSSPEPSRPIISHKEKLRPKTSRDLSQDHTEGRWQHRDLFQALQSQSKAGPLNRGATVSRTPFSSA